LSKSTTKISAYRGVSYTDKEQIIYTEIHPTMGANTSRYGNSATYGK